MICSLGHGGKHMLTILPTVWRPSFRAWADLNNSIVEKIKYKKEEYVVKAFV